MGIGQKANLSLVIRLGVTLMGLLALGLVLSADAIYRERSHTQQISALTGIIELAAEKRLAELKRKSAELGNRLQQESALRQAFKYRDIETLRFWLDQEFHRYFVTAGILNLERLFLLDLELQPVAASNEGESQIRPLDQSCAELHQSALSRTLVERIKPLARLCQDQGHSSLISLISLGGLKPIGYLQISVDIGSAFAHMHQELGTPVRILQPDGSVAGQSTDWPATLPAAEDFLLFDYQYPADAEFPLLTIQAISDVRAFHADLNRTRNLIAGGAMAAMLLMLTGLHWLLQQRFSQPLQALRQAAEGVIKGDFKPVDTATACPELQTPIRSFDRMVTEVQQEIRERSQAEEAMRQARDEVSRAMESLRHEREFSTVTLDSISDAVVATDEFGRIRYLNPQAAKICRVEMEQVVGDDFTDLLPICPEEDGSKRSLDWLELIKPGRDYTQALCLDTDDGPQRFIDLRMAPMRNGQGESFGYVAIFRDVTESRRISKKLAHDATHDQLTGLHNRAALEQKVQQLLEEATEGANHVLAFMDLDQFKVVNDTCGHAAGDELLRQLTRWMLEKVSRRDMLARLGGDEFGLVLSQCDIQHGENIARRLRDLIRDFRFDWQDKSFKVGVSIGLVSFGEPEDELGQILSAADTACYLAKDSGGNRIAVHNLDQLEVRQRHGEMNWVSRITQALDQGSFILYAQPIMALEPILPERMHWEILVRMQGKDGKLIPPGAFLPAAERFKLITAVDRWIFSKSLEYLSKWPADAADPLFSINLSGHSLTDPGCLDFIVGSIADRAVNPEHLCFEITETAAIGHLNEAQRFISVLRGTGCRFALDDFGSGLCSFGYLRNLPVDYIKIDGLFVRDSATCAINRSVVKAIHDIGQVMEKKTVAEYVENAEILQILHDLGIDHAQGYGIAEPRPLEEMMAELQTTSDKAQLRA